MKINASRKCIPSFNFTPPLVTLLDVSPSQPYSPATITASSISQPYPQARQKSCFPQSENDKKIKANWRVMCDEMSAGL
jgi:hypothetical protein